MKRPLIVALSFAAFVCLTCFAQEDQKREAVVAYLKAAIMGVEQIHEPSTALSILEEAGKSLQEGCANRCEGVFSGLYESIVQNKQRRNNSDRAELFRRFLHVVSRVDPQLAATYMERFRNEHPEIKMVTWETANDLFDEDYSRSLQIASSAAISTSDFPDAALTYLRKVAGQSPQDLENLTREVLTQSAVFPLNSRLELLAYLFGDQRVPQLMGQSLTDKAFAEQPAGGARASDAFIARFAAQIRLNPLSYPRDDLYVLLLAEAHLKSAETKMMAGLKKAEARDMEGVTPEVAATITADVAKWMAGPEAAKSAQNSSHDNRNSEEDKLHYRAIMLQALSLAHEEKLSEALEIVSLLPLRTQDNARDILLVVAADAITSHEKARELVGRVPRETRSDFILAYAEAAAARVAAHPPQDPDENPSSLLTGVEDIAANLRGVRRLVLELRAANTWIIVDNDRAFAALDSSLKYLNEDKGLDGAPLLTMILGIPGMSGQYNAGQASVYQLIRMLAKRDIDSTLAHLSVSNRDDIRLQGIVAACVEYLSQHTEDSAAASTAKQ